jgi:uncharacterized protein (DUF427 family)
MTDEERAAYWRSMRRGRPPADEIEKAGPGEESVWDYPRPPRLEFIDWPLKVTFAGTVIAETARGARVLETAGAPTYYFPPEDVRQELLRPIAGTSFCEWKGRAVYWDIVVNGRVAEAAAWSYPRPTAEFEAIGGWFAFYPGRVGACWARGEQVSPQPGGFYGGWVTSWIKGPIKGRPGTEGW